jgi:CRP-like cAMP-binding protein
VESSSARPVAENPLPSPGNRLLAALPQTEYLRIARHLEWVALPRGKVLSESGERLTHAFFPTDGIISVQTGLENEIPTEVAIVGREGMVGVSILLEGPDARGPLRRSLVQTAGHAYRIPAEHLLKEFEHGGKLWQHLLRYTQALITQVAQVAVCNRCHGIDEQLCRWLLQRLDCQESAEIFVTQQEIADLLGVRREGVSAIAGRLHDAGVIGYARGHLVVLDRMALAHRSCECVGVIRKEYARLLGVQAPT